MDTLEFISTLVGDLAWPLVILILILTLKKPISQILLGITKFKYNNLEMDFGKKLTEIEKTLEEKKTITDITENRDEWHAIREVAEISPNAAITMAWNMVEKEIKSTIMRLAISPDYPPYNSTLKNIIKLKENGLIDQETENSLNEMRILRNRSVHSNETHIKLTYSEAIRYFEIAKKVISVLKSIK